MLRENWSCHYSLQRNEKGALPFKHSLTRYEPTKQGFWLRLLFIWIVVHPNISQNQLPKAEEKKTICTQSKEEMQVTVDEPPCANAPLGAIAAATRTTINDHAFGGDMMNEIWEKGMLST